MPRRRWFTVRGSVKPAALAMDWKSPQLKRAGEAFAIKHRVGGKICRDAPVGIDIGEVELAAGLQQAVCLAEDFRLVGAQIDDAV